MSTHRALTAISLLFLVVACDSDPGPDEPGEDAGVPCEISGETDECACPGGAVGARVCRDDGFWSECTGCPCVPDCSGRVCGPDPLCRQSCGDCPMDGEDEQVCDEDGQCVTAPPGPPGCDRIPERDDNMCSGRRAFCCSGDRLGASTGCMGRVMMDCDSTHTGVAADYTWCCP